MVLLCACASPETPVSSPAGDRPAAPAGAAVPSSAPEVAAPSPPVALASGSEPAPHVEREAEPLDPFPDRVEVTVDELIAAIEALADDIGREPVVRADYLALVEAKGLVDSEALFADYLRVKLAFEATRDAGWWHLHWRITNQAPNSERIWRQWEHAGVPGEGGVTAEAECDELSALFAFVARKLGVKGIGLYWPTWNHVVAVWTVPGAQTQTGSSVRIIVPTSQIFLTQDDSLGTDGFDPWTQKTIYEYRRRDMKGEHRIDADLARFFVQQIAEHGRASQRELQRARNARDARLSAG